MTDRQLLPIRRGAVAVIRRADRLLVIRRSRSVTAPRMYCFPGGAIEGEETEAEALIRELQEELSVAVTPMQKLWSSVTPWRVHLAWWLAELPPDAALVPNPLEVESFHWLTPEEMFELPELLSSNREFLLACRSGAVAWTC